MIDEPSADPARCYVNAFAARPGIVDVTLNFGFAAAGEEVDPSIALTMTWELARFVAGHLAQHVAQYEAEVGPIRDVQSVPFTDPSQNGGTTGGQDDDTEPTSPPDPGEDE